VIHKKKVLALITARAGSKGLSEKNIKLLIGKPLLAWPISAAKKSRYVDRVVLSTDSEKFADIAKKYGADVPFIRLSELATDLASSSSVVEHALMWLWKNEQQLYDYVVLLEPTSPLTDNNDIDKALEKLFRNDSTADSIVGVCKVEAKHPKFLYAINKFDLLVPYMQSEKQHHIRRQDLNDLYFLEGSLYVSKVDAFLANKSFYHEKTLPYLVPKWKAFEIDDIVDFYCVEAILKNLLKEDSKND